MKAIYRTGYGGPEVLELRDVDQPTPAEGEVLVRVRASSMNMADVDYVRGRPWVGRLAAGLREPRARIPGIDMAGEVEALGPGASRFAVGDPVFADLFDVGSGAWAEYVAVPQLALTPMPADVPFEVAACVPSGGVFGIQGVRDKRPVGPGDEVLVNGASGNVGPFAVQVAKHCGAEVTGTCRTEKMEMVRSLGADHVIDYSVEDYRSAGKRYDLIVDIASRGGILRQRSLLKPGGGYVLIGGTGRAYLDLHQLCEGCKVATLRLFDQASLHRHHRFGAEYISALSPSMGRQVRRPIPIGLAPRRRALLCHRAADLAPNHGRVWCDRPSLAGITDPCHAATRIRRIQGLRVSGTRLGARSWSRSAAWR